MTEEELRQKANAYLDRCTLRLGFLIIPEQIRNDLVNMYVAGALDNPNRVGESEWQYDEDTGNVMCRCPGCGGRLLIGLYQYSNPYHYCPYCGMKLKEGKIRAKRLAVYKLEQEAWQYGTQDSDRD